MKLTLLDLGGSAVTISLATSAFSIALIPAVALSGSISDFVSRRQSILIVSSLGQLISVLLLGQSRNPQEIIVLYTVYSFFCNLTPTVFSVLMLETVPKTRWGKGRDLILRNMIYGNILGLIINELVLSRFPLAAISPLPTALAGVMLIMSLLIRDPPMTLERRSISFQSDGLVDRLTQLPVIIFHIPNPRDFSKMFQNGRNFLTRDIPVLVGAMSLYYLGSNLFTTSFTPFLRSNQLSYLEIVGLDIFLSIINALAIMNQLSDVSRRGDPAIAVEFFSLRAIAFLFAGLSAIYFTGRPILYLTIPLYLMIGMAQTNITIGMNKMIYDRLPSGLEGGILGVYSALNNSAILCGSLFSGSISLILGYQITFLIAGLLLFTSASLMEWHFQPTRSWDDDPYQ